MFSAVKVYLFVLLIYSTPRSGSRQPGAGDAPMHAANVSDSGRGCGRIYLNRGGRTGRSRGRGRGVSSGERRGVGRRTGWSRSEPLVERFASNEELPAPLREEIDRVSAARTERERTMRARSARRATNVEVEEDASDVENDDSEEFVWMSMDEWSGVKETFVPESSGPSRIFENAYDAFRSYWDDSLLSHIVSETNRYAQGVQSAKFCRDWYETNIHELLMLFAFWMMLGIHKMPTIKSCFSKHTILRTEIFRSMFSEDRYWNVNRAFHLANGSRDTNNPDNILYPMGPVIDQLNEKFQQNYRLSQDICIDESLTLWKGPLGFKQYIKTKSARFGIKSFQLCESSTGYLWSFFIYVGRRTTNSTLPSSASTVIKLVQPLLNLGHVLYMDNWFNSPMLARYLKRRRTDCVGTLRPSRRKVPAVIQRTPLVEGEFVARQSGDVMVVALQDRKRLTCLSTFHGVTQVHKEARPGRSSHFKLELIEDYNHGMGGVDRLDQMLEPYLVERKQCVKWTRKLFKRLLNITVQNARILLEKSSNTKISSLTFRLALVQSIIDCHRSHIPLRNPQNPTPRPRISHSQFPAERLTERHFIRRIPITDEMRANVRHSSNLGRRQCVWCTANGRRGSRTAYECPQCKVSLCLDFCFEQFHTIP